MTKKIKKVRKKIAPKIEKQIKDNYDNLNKSSNKKFFFILSFILILLFLLLESYYVFQKDTKMKKRAELINSWHAIYKSIVCTVVYGDNFYAICERTNQIQVHNKINGQLIGIFQAENGEPIWVAADKEGIMYAILRNSNIIWKIKDFKKIGEFTATDLSAPSSIVIDSNDIIYISDSKSGKIVKFNLAGEKIGEFAGYGNSKNKITGSLGRIFIDNKHNIYAILANPCRIKIFNSNGNFINEFKLPKDDICQLANIAPTPDENIYINDFPGSRILVFNRKGKLLSSFNKDVTGNFLITYPATIAGGVDGNLYVGTSSIAVMKPIKY